MTLQNERDRLYSVRTNHPNERFETMSFTRNYELVYPIIEVDPFCEQIRFSDIKAGDDIVIVMTPTNLPPGVFEPVRVLGTAKGRIYFEPLEDSENPRILHSEFYTDQDNFAFTYFRVLDLNTYYYTFSEV